MTAVDPTEDDFFADFWYFPEYDSPDEWFYADGGYLQEYDSPDEDFYADDGYIQEYDSPNEWFYADDGYIQEYDSPDEWFYADDGYIEDYNSPDENLYADHEYPKACTHTDPELYPNTDQQSEPEIDSVIEDIRHLRLLPNDRSSPSSLLSTLRACNSTVPTSSQHNNSSQRARNTTADRAKSWVSLREKAHAGLLLFRIPQPDSLSPLTPNGFLATSIKSVHRWTIRQCANEISRAKAHSTSTLDIDGSTDQWIRHITHWRVTRNDASSDWISMTEDPDWVFWSMTKRFLNGCPSKISISSIRRPSMSVDSPMIAYKATSRLKPASWFVGDEARKAWHFAKASGEWLALYLIPLSEVVTTDVVTANVLPYEFPAYYFKSTPPRTGQRWIEEVIFDPYSKETYYEASAKMRARARELGIDDSNIGG
ncbi:hypothetical protein IAT40_003995 [Kwoniella sp. CBS 6097]